MEIFKFFLIFSLFSSIYTFVGGFVVFSRNRGVSTALNNINTTPIKSVSEE
jgi:hypothetical protein